MIPLIICSVYALYWVIEVFHDDKLRKINNIALSLDRAYDALDEAQELKKLSSSWHSLDWKGHAILAVLTGYLASTGSEFVVQDWIIVALYALVIGSMRVLILNIGGNLIAKRSVFYVGSRGLESKFKGKEIVYYALWLAIFVVSLFLIIRF